MKNYKRKSKFKKFYYYYLYKFLNLAEIIMAVIWIVFIVRDCICKCCNIVIYIKTYKVVIFFEKKNDTS